ncbi:MAG: hypothetical protein ISF22_06835 [Methanomassiliicoccus sp.]|nr:hypothetical protein [Methanomassiliicoccus sp.]
MTSKSSGTLWIFAIALIAIFTVATVIAPELTGHGKNNSGNNWNTDMPSGEPVFQSPVTTLSASTLTVNETVVFTLNASPVDDTTGKGGNFAWVFQLEGGNGQSNIANLVYSNGESQVIWMSASEGSVRGVGPKFYQGPGAVAMDVSTSLSITFNKAGAYVLKSWIATASDSTSLDPASFTSVSPMVRSNLAVKDEVKATVNMQQVMSVPSGTTTNGTWGSYTIYHTAQATGKWNNPVEVRIAIDKAGINVSDVSVRIRSGSGYTFPTLTDSGDKLTAVLSTNSPFSGTSDSESADWTTSFEVSYRTPGDYMLTSWSTDKTTGKELSLMTYNAITVTSPVVPEPEPPVVPPVEPVPNGTNGTNATDSPSVVPLNNTYTLADGVEPATTQSASGRSEA